MRYEDLLRDRRHASDKAYLPGLDARDPLAWQSRELFTCAYEPRVREPAIRVYDRLLKGPPGCYGPPDFETR